MSHGTVIGPALAECLKDANTPVRLAAERCAVHAFQLTKGTYSCIFFLCSLSFIHTLLLGNVDYKNAFNFY
jgi:hypothetical protein